MESIDWYMDFVDKSYTPSEDELIALYRIEPALEFTVEEAAGRVASESSVGTWTTLTTLTENVRRLMAKAYEFDGKYVKIAYKPDLFEPGNIPQILSAIAGNIFGMKAVQYLRLVDIGWPKSMIGFFKGPQFGIDGVRKRLNIHGRPILATVPKPKVGLTTEEHVNVGYEVWLGGVDLLKDDENLTDLSFNRFEERVKLAFRYRDKAEKETGERKSYLVNITGDVRKMEKRAKLVSDYGGEYVMVDILTVGWGALQTMREVCEDLKLAIHAHRAFHSAFTRNPYHGMSMTVVGELARLIGVDQLHIGTVIGKLDTPKEEVLAIKEKITSGKCNGGKGLLYTDWGDIKPVLPVSSGGLHPGLIPHLLNIIGTDIAIQVGGGVLGHPSGPRAGAKAIRDAMQAYLEGIPLKEYAEKSEELAEALRKWGEVTYR
jgi:ribulose-bisphosphate carboxylase large chain